MNSDFKERENEVHAQVSCNGLGSMQFNEGTVNHLGGHLTLPSGRLAKMLPSKCALSLR